jgi:hypothetical protein
MTDGWVKAFDQSFQRVTDFKAAYDAGFRVMAGYAGGGTSDKWLTVAEIEAWFACGDDTGIAALFEIVGDEPLTEPAAGGTHAKSARAAWRARGYPDDAAISAAMDRNVTMTQAHNQLAEYFRAWASADTFLPMPYVESDAGAYLHSLGITCGTFSPAAYGWDNPAVLLTPANAPDHVLWTQEHNGVRLAGGSVDVGHIRTSAPIWWRTPMPLSDADLAAVNKAVWQTDKSGPNYPWMGDAATNAAIKGWSAVQDAGNEAHAANVGVQAVQATLAGMVKTEAAIQTALNGLVANGGSADSTALAAIAAQIKAVGDSESAHVASLQTTVNTLLAQVAQLKADLAAAAQAAAADLAK